MERYRLTLIGGPNCGTAMLEEVETWPPPQYLYVKGVEGVYRRTRISLQGMEELDFRSARYEWQQS
jgi:hypothetical protein